VLQCQCPENRANSLDATAQNVIQLFTILLGQVV
jgi:hypothetical protein